MFDIEKATQATAYLLWKEGGKMPYAKLMKKLYEAERQFILKYSEPLTGDTMIAMPSGPALVFTYECFLAGSAYWDNWIENSGNYELAIRNSVLVDADNPLETFDSLSVAEKDTLDSVFESDASSPELVNLNSVPHPISLQDLLTKNGKSKKETQAILQKFEELESLRAATAKLT